MRQMRVQHHHNFNSLLSSGNPTLLHIPSTCTITSRRADFPEAGRASETRLKHTYYFPDLGVRVGRVLMLLRVQQDPTMAHVRSRESLEFYSRHHDAQKDRAAVRAEIGDIRGTDYSALEARARMDTLEDTGSSS
ncbi:hypothetical protein Tco_0955094 [Tanacetum coccineum]|uniref:Uncharacterized protein n=1 Tax=Tanacetum coccineum TaxID=301880 RepID=A0ABQ5E6A7_9ASTR